MLQNSLAPYGQACWRYTFPHQLIFTQCANHISAQSFDPTLYNPCRLHFYTTYVNPNFAHFVDSILL